MKKILQLSLMAAAMMMSLTACDLNFYGGTPTTYGRLDNYYVNNEYYNQYYYDTKASNIVITDRYEFQRVFGMATTMGSGYNYGVPTNVDFNHEFVIAVVLPVTDYYTEIEPVSLNREGNKLYFTYKVYRGTRQGYYTQPFTAVVADRRDLVEIVFQQMNSSDSYYRGSDHRVSGYYSGGTYYGSGYYNGGYYYNTVHYNAPIAPPVNWRDNSRIYNYNTFNNYYYNGNGNGYYDNRYNNGDHRDAPQGRRPASSGNNSGTRSGSVNQGTTQPSTSGSYNYNNNTNTRPSSTNSSGGRRPTATNMNGSTSSSNSSTATDRRAVSTPSTSTGTSSNTNNNSNSGTTTRTHRR